MLSMNNWPLQEFVIFFFFILFNMLFDFDFTCVSKYIVYSFVYKLLSLAHLLAKFVSSIDYYLAWIEDSSCFLQQFTTSSSPCCICYFLNTACYLYLKIKKNNKKKSYYLLQNLIMC